MKTWETKNKAGKRAVINAAQVVGVFDRKDQYDTVGLTVVTGFAISLHESVTFEDAVEGLFGTDH